MLSTKEIIEVFGKPGDDRNLATFKLPYVRRIGFMPGATTQRIQCHRKLGGLFQAVHEDLLKHYGLHTLQQLGIDIFDGCYNLRKMRGGNEWSRHSWGIAEDVNANANGLYTPWPKSLFSKPEYRPMMEIYYSHGFCNQGVEKGFDAMHFEFMDLNKL